MPSKPSEKNENSVPRIIIKQQHLQVILKNLPRRLNHPEDEAPSSLGVLIPSLPERS
jgi:hypothetical protein